MGTLEGRALAQQFLAGCQQRKTVNRKHSSYGWKHAAERQFGGYVSNEDFIAVARAAGFKIQWIPDSPNCWLNISQKSWC